MRFVAALKGFAADRGLIAGRWRRAARVASVTALGAGLMATLQITNPLGLTLLFNFGAPELAFSAATGIIFLACAGLLQWLALALAGALVTSPAAHLGCFIVVSFLTTYFIYASPELGRLWVWVQVPIVSAFYTIIFRPSAIVFGSAELLAGLVVAVALLLLCNKLLWPRPPALALRESIAATLTQSRNRLQLLIRAVVQDSDFAFAGGPPIASRLGYHLTLLQRTLRQASDRSEAAVLLTDLILTERLRHETDRLAFTLRTLEPGLVAAAAIIELSHIGATLDSQFARYIENVTDDALSPEDSAAASPAALAHGLRRLAAAEPVLAPLTAPLETICRVLDRDPLELPRRGSPMPLQPRKPMAIANRFLLRFSGRHTLALTIAFLIGLYDNTPALQASIWLLMLGGPPTHGATVRKFTMRALGAVGALSLAALAIIIVAPNFTSLPPYMLVIFIGALLMTYAGESGGIVSYISVGGTAFVIAFSGPGPRLDLIRSVWTVWGVSLGMVIRAAISLLSRERASQTLAEQFQPPLASMIALLDPSADEVTGIDQIAAAEMALISGIGTILEVANDAQLEGRTAAIDAAVLIAALDTFRRLGFLIGNIQLLDHTRQSPPAPIVAGRLNPLRLLFASWLDHLQAYTGSGIVSRAPLRDMVTHSAELSFHDPINRPTSHPIANLPSGSTSDSALADRIRALLDTLSEQFTRISLHHP